MGGTSPGKGSGYSLPSGGVGPVGPANVETVVLDFTFATVSPALVAGLLPSDVLLMSSITITETFDGVGAAVSLGTTLTGAASQVPSLPTTSPALANTYRNRLPYRPAALDSLLLSITPGAGATTGAGYVLATVKR